MQIDLTDTSQKKDFEASSTLGLDFAVLFEHRARLRITNGELWDRSIVRRHVLPDHFVVQVEH